MIDSIKKISLILLFNTFIFIMMLISIQNSNYKSKVNLIFFETINLPLSFIIGSSFILGSLTGTIAISNTREKN